MRRREHEPPARNSRAHPSGQSEPEHHAACRWAGLTSRDSGFGARMSVSRVGRWGNPASPPPGPFNCSQSAAAARALDSPEGLCCRTATHLPPRRGGIGLPANLAWYCRKGGQVSTVRLLEAASDGRSALYIRDQVPGTAGLLLLANPASLFSAREAITADLLALAGFQDLRG